MNYNRQHQRQDDDEYDDYYDYGDASSTYPMEQRMTPQQQRQEERRRHGEQATASAGGAGAVHGSAASAAAAAGTGASPWLDKQKKKSSKVKTIGWAVGVLLVLAIAGVLAWYFAVFKKNQNGSGSSGGKSGDGGHATGPTVISPNGTVIPNENYEFKRVFYGMAYVPLNAQLPNCFNTQATVDEELQLLAKTTRRVRLYGTDCSVLRFTLDAIKRLKLDLKVVVGIWIDKEVTTYTRQRDEFYAVAQALGWENIIGVSVGNEVIFDSYQSMDFLIAAVKEVRAKVTELGHPEIPVFTSDLESANKPPLTNNEDKAGVNLHPFFSGVPASEGAAWFWKYLKEKVQPAVNSNNTTPIDIWITEVGWPTFPTHAATNSSIPSIPNLQTFLDTWLCEANKQNLPYYFFEFFDAPWKIWPGSSVEGFWGLLTIDKKLKVKLPDCLAN